MRLFFTFITITMTLVFAYPQQKQFMKNVNGYEKKNFLLPINSSEIYSTDSILFSEGFDGMWLPDGWSRITFHSTKHWKQSNYNINFNEIYPGSKYSALVDWDVEDQDEWLISPLILISELPATLQWYAGISGPWLTNATLRCLVSIDNGSTWKVLWDAVDNIDFASDWQWNYIETSLNEYIDKPIKIAWNYVGSDGDLAAIDGIKIKLGENYIFSSDFEEYNIGDFLVLNDTTGFWTTWNNEPGGDEDAIIVDKQAYSPTKSVEVTDSGNLVLQFGEKTTGIYKIEVKYYIADGNSACFDVQHFEEAGFEEAFSIIFDTLGEGHINAGMENVFSFNYFYDTWITISALIDLDDDQCEFYLDKNLIYSWPFHYQSDTQMGTLQLGCINFLTSNPQNEESGFYFDDIDIVGIKASSLDPNIYISDTAYSIVLNLDDTSTQMIRIGNTGFKDLHYQIVTTYPKPDDIKLNKQQFYKNRKRIPTSNTALNDTLLNYDGENVAALGDSTKDYEWQIAAKFAADLIKPFIGMEINEVELFINDQPIETSIQIFKMGPLVSGQPGELLYEQNFIAEPYSWNAVILDSPFYLDGEDIWVSLRLKGNKGDLITGVDSGPADPNGNWISFGNGWGHLSDSLGVNANWNIRAYLKQEPVNQWLSANSVEGILKEYGYADIECLINGSGVQEGNYVSEMIIRNNDLTNEQKHIKFYLDVVSGIEENKNDPNIFIYPNPAKSTINIKSSDKIEEVRVFNLTSKAMYRQSSIRSFETTFNASTFSKGFYLVQIRTENGISVAKIIIE